MKRIGLAAAALVACLSAASAQDRTREETLHKLKNLKLTIDFKDAALEEVLDYLREIANINLVVDAGVSAEDTKVSITLTEVAMSSVLKLLLEPLECGVMLKDNVLMVMRKEDIRERTLKLELYDCRDLLYPIRDFPGIDIALKSDQIGTEIIDTTGVQEPTEIPLEELIRAHTGGATWDENPRTSCLLQNGILVVRQSPDVHREIIRLIDMLRRNK